MFASQDLTAGQLNAIVKKLGGKGGALRFLQGKVEVVMDSFLDLVRTVSVPAQESFVAADHFMVDMSDEAEVRINYIGDDFNTRFRFLNNIENPVGRTELVVHTLTKPSEDELIIARFRDDKVETYLSQLWALLKNQGHGKSGPLLTNGCANVFYIRDASDKLWAVVAYWESGQAWYIYCSPIVHPNG